MIKIENKGRGKQLRNSTQRGLRNTRSNISNYYLTSFAAANVSVKYYRNVPKYALFTLTNHNDDQKNVCSQIIVITKKCCERKVLDKMKNGVTFLFQLTKMGLAKEGPVRELNPGPLAP